MLDDSDFQNLKERVEHLDGVPLLGPLTELRDRVDKLEADASWAPLPVSPNESRR